MNELQIFNFDSNEVRTVVVNEEPYFVGKDVDMAIQHIKNLKASQIEI